MAALLIATTILLVTFLMPSQSSNERQTFTLAPVTEQGQAANTAAAPTYAKTGDALSSQKDDGQIHTIAASNASKGLSHLQQARPSATVQTQDQIGTATPAIAALQSQTSTRAVKPNKASTIATKQQATSKSQWTEIEIRQGDSLARLFKRHGLSANDLHHLVTNSSDGHRLKRIFPGHQFRYQLDPQSRLAKLQYQPGPLEIVEFARNPTDSKQRFSSRTIAREPERRSKRVEAEIQSSLFMASANAGINDNLTMNLASIFQWDIDFVLDIRKGDKFSFLFEELFLDGKKIANGRILAAQFTNRSQRYEAVYFEDSSGVGNYYTPEGRSMRKAFLRAPVEFSRISSNFNLRRVHPVRNRVMPHRGIDYAAPNGTPILAAGDGRILTAEKHRANGNYIVIKHGETYQTKYLHLSRFARGIKKGKSVKQGQTIGYVGATGLATGPHLHYEFLVNGVHRNPRTVPLPQARPVPSSERAAFQQVANTRLSELSGTSEATAQLAQAAGNSNSATAIAPGGD